MVLSLETILLRQCLAEEGGTSTRAARASLGCPLAVYEFVPRAFCYLLPNRKPFHLVPRLVTLSVPDQSEAKAILRTWSPGMLEACSQGNFAIAMGGLKGSDSMSFERLCEIAAAVLASSPKQVRDARQTRGDTRGYPTSGGGRISLHGKGSPSSCLRIMDVTKVGATDCTRCSVTYVKAIIRSA